jgi:acetyl esterase/lipase
MDFSKFGYDTPEWRDYLSHHPQLSPDSPSTTQNRSLAVIRNAANAGRATWSENQIALRHLRKEFRTKDYISPTQDGSTLPIRCYYPSCQESSLTPLPAFIHYHGGGFLNGSLDTETFICGLIASKLNIVVIHPQYRHTDEFKHPTHINDGWDSFEWTLQNHEALGFDPGKLVIGGQSAGSLIAATITQRDAKIAQEVGRKCRIHGQVLTIPWLMQPQAFPYHQFADKNITSPVQCAHKVGLSQEKFEWFAELLQPSDPHDPLLNPGLQQGQELIGLPKAAFLVAGGDPLRDQAFYYAKSLEQAK